MTFDGENTADRFAILAGGTLKGILSITSCTFQNFVHSFLIQSQENTATYFNTHELKTFTFNSNTVKDCQGVIEVKGKLDKPITNTNFNSNTF